MRNAGTSRRGVAEPRALITLAAAGARGDAAAGARAIARARRAGWPRRALEEVALMLMLHAGYPAALETSALLSRVWPGRARRSREGGVREWRARGARLCARIYGAQYPRLVANVESLHPDLAVMMIEQGYGRVLSRPGLDAVTRELVAVTVLANGGWQRQLVSHLLGARRMGATRRAIRMALDAGLSRSGVGAREAAAQAWSVAFPEDAARG